MEQLELPIAARSVTGKRVATLRRAGIVPAVIFGPGMASLSIQVELRQLEPVLGRAGRTTVVALMLGRDRYETMIREVRRHAIRGTIEHVDFFLVQADRPVRAEVPIVLVGESPAIRAGGTLIHGLATLTVEARPGDLPHAIQVDLTRLANVDDAIHVRDLPLGERLRVLDDPNELVVRSVPMRAEAVAAPGAAGVTPTAASPEPERPAEGETTGR